jgi:hypothetical protein
MRSDSRFLIENKAAFIASLQQSNLTSIIDSVEKLVTIGRASAAQATRWHFEARRD